MSLNISKRLMDHVFLAVEEGLLPLKAGRPLTPFILAITKEGVIMRRFTDEKMSDALDRAYQELAELNEDTLAYALVFDAVVTVDEKDSDAVMVEVGERNVPQGYRFVQRYQPKQGTNPMYTIGQVAYMGEAELLLK